MHGNKTPIGQPCRNGHPYRRNKRGQCITCRSGHASRNNKRKRPPNYLIETGRAWIWTARKALRRRSAGPRPSLEALVTLWDRQGGMCGLTGVKIAETPHLDHKLAVAKGGRNDIDNLHFVHPMANNAKNSHSIEEFRTWLLAAADALKKKIELENLF